VDIFAGRDGEVLLVQVKGEKSRMSGEELKLFLRWVEAFNARGEVWYFTRRGIRRVELGRAEGLLRG
jgi:Holliday junction resolvase